MGVLAYLEDPLVGTLGVGGFPIFRNAREGNAVLGGMSFDQPFEQGPNDVALDFSADDVGVQTLAYGRDAHYKDAFSGSLLDGAFLTTTQSQRKQ